jgi:complement component 1 Q subcomponent-binding protein
MLEYEHLFALYPFDPFWTLIDHPSTNQIPLNNIETMSNALLYRLSTRLALKGTAKSFARSLEPRGKDAVLTYLRASGDAVRVSHCLGVRMFSSPSGDLADILGREMEEEVNAGSTHMPPDLSVLKAKIENDWRIVDDGATAKLFRKDNSGVKVAISVHCQDTVDDAIDEEGNEQEEQEERSPPLRFTVAVSKAGKTLVLTCLSEDTETFVESAAVSSQELEAILTSGGVESHNYQGPAFAELAEDLQEAFHVYLRSLVNEDVAAFLPMYADYLEQQQYVQFLKQAQSIL